MAIIQQGSKEDLKRQLAQLENELEGVRKKDFDTSKEKEEAIATAIGRKKVIELRLTKVYE